MATQSRPIAERFWPKVDTSAGPDACWPWMAQISSDGYGRFFVVTPRVASRVSWELANGQIPEGLFVLHRCDNPPCVNPAHLFLGTQADNMRDMAEKGRRVQQGPNCRNGHPVSPDNSYIRANSYRCGPCSVLATRRYRAKRRQRVVAG